MKLLDALDGGYALPPRPIGINWGAQLRQHVADLERCNLSPEAQDAAEAVLFEVGQLHKSMETVYAQAIGTVTP